MTKRLTMPNGVVYICPNDNGNGLHNLAWQSPAPPWCSTCNEALRVDEGPHGSVVGAGKKYDAGKLRYDLVDPFALAWLASTLTYGASKYAPWNWLLFSKEELREKYYAAMIRHVESLRMGQDDDPESGLPHVAMMMFGSMILTATFAPRDLGEILSRTKEAIRRLQPTITIVEPT